VRVKWLKSAKWEGFMLEPVFLFGFNDEALRPGQMPVLSEEAPAINFAVIKSRAVGNEAFVMEEAAKLAEELGLGEPDVPDFDEVVERLTRVRREWDWKEPINPHRLSNDPPLSKLEAEGIYNRCIVFGGERSPYTKGLEQELAKLQEASEDRYARTALGMWLARKVEWQQASAAEVITLLEPLPLNSEQREAFDHLLPAADRFPRVWIIPYNLACCRAQLGRVDQARRWFERALAIDQKMVRQAAADDS
jgi:tetratricopeptide (TPR) repeat protein